MRRYDPPIMEVGCQLFMDDTTRRLDAIDNELEIGFDQKFETKWRKLKIASQA